MPATTGLLSSVNLGSLGASYDDTRRPTAEASRENMKAILLCAGQGRRLLPLTTSRPKCLLPVLGRRTVLEHQLQALAECGVDQACVLVGFGASQAEGLLASHRIPGITARTLYNPFYATTDNLVTCWIARAEMEEDFVLLNGDTLFETTVLARLLSAPPAPLTVAINRKHSYDSDDMKVALDSSGRLRAVGKTLDPEIVDGESIGMMRFQGRGTTSFRRALDDAVRKPSALKAWYLSVVNEMAAKLHVRTVSITGLWWGEIDGPRDLMQVRTALELRERTHQQSAPVALRAGGLSG